jgi:hypothetical protein
MKKFFGIGVVALALVATEACATRGYRYRRYGPPPPPPPPRGEMFDRHHGGHDGGPGDRRWKENDYGPRHGKVWVAGHRERRGGGYVWVEGYWR